ncbi:hypothetical protein F6R97_04080 [Pseudomonas sp. JV414]|uniref:hypothetical protein n=1 Tax=Pseudomonas sp. JV414 TaxID=1733110 RepID=UPI0028E16528|nr:hypothetical protein [Pseudomonas sp. JV414]MDT9673833.1 hypothetical protein [Pseudomonas sp. JV414]
MMEITVFGQRYDNEPFELIKKGDSLFINGEQFDFFPMPEGATLPGTAVQSKWFSLGQITKEENVIKLSLLYPVPANYSPEQATPQLLTNVADGPVALPQALVAPEEEVEE